ncbi:sepiapterin reductase-like [Xenia sp. Carnegie-2017]|uniref:sepiapterin reductase-like n=1 Tax=Xenia sp. Carnegie-2017 TaxID=2897299 RepID=UPI001F0335FA|nr:sepiapterin reductase-like [Xenia sp. Carnegie-2017]
MFEGKSFVIVTGSSKGFGKAVTKLLASEFSQNENAKKSVFVLVARSKQELEETKNTVLEMSSCATVHVVVANLADLNSLDNVISCILSLSNNPSDYSCAMLLNNAACVGDKLMSISGENNLSDIREYMDFNITSSVYLTSCFIKHFSSIKTYVINISSLCAIQAMPSLSLYCTGKAARDMFHQVLAKESSDIRVLNYAPGPMDTAMYDKIIKDSDSEHIRNSFCQLKSEKKILKPETSAKKLVLILKEDRYQSGRHIDYFDDMP